ncbi:helix-turn-helix domain-containing protein, partial [Planktotalea sp.]|uniref:helix-turn-helix domain-containing protein n=1 Tax=Planktotalea sp. TaxID=2029877 RepID=UPI0032998CC2
ELVDFMAGQLTRSEDIRFTNTALKALMDYTWPGNLRELQNVITRALRKSNGANIKRHDLVFSQIPNIDVTQSLPVDQTKTQTAPQTERDWILAKLVEHGWRRASAAEDLGMSTRTLFNKIKKYQLDL